MIVLNEQLLGRNIEAAIAHWYPGRVCFITSLRPGTIIKDAAIPALLQQESQPKFVTINETDFWRMVAITERFAVVCLALPDSRSGEISALLQRLLRHVDFRTKAKRMGHVIRLTGSEAHCYSVRDRMVRPIMNW